MRRDERAAFAGELEEIDEVEQLVRAGFRITFAILDQMENNLMATFQELVQADADLASEVDLILADVENQTSLIADLQAQIAALSGGTITPEQQAQLDATVADLKAQHDKIAAALPATPVVAPSEPPAEPTP